MRQAWGGVKNTAEEPDIPWFKAGRIPKGWITWGGRPFTSLEPWHCAWCCDDLCRDDLPATLKITNGPMSHSDLVTLQIPEPGGLCGMVVPRTSLAVP